MKHIDFALRLFVDRRDRERSERAIHLLLHAIVCVDREWIEATGAHFPSPTDLAAIARARRSRQGRGRAVWQDASRVRSAKIADIGAVGLACWRVADDCRRGIRSRPALVRRGSRTYEIAVRYPDGRTWHAPWKETYTFDGKPVHLDVDLFGMEGDRERSERALHFLLHALVCIDAEWIKAFPKTPPLYRSGVRYEREAPGQEEWQDIPTMLSGQNYQHKRTGDCEDLACWRVAEYLLHGQRARPYIRYRLLKLPDGKTEFSLYHILTQRPDRVVEDPSKRLGMGAKSPEAQHGLVGEAMADDSASEAYIVHVPPMRRRASGFVGSAAADLPYVEFEEGDESPGSISRRMNERAIFDELAEFRTPSDVSRRMDANYVKIGEDEEPTPAAINVFNNVEIG